MERGPPSASHQGSEFKRCDGSRTQKGEFRLTNGAAPAGAYWVRSATMGSTRNALHDGTATDTSATRNVNSAAAR